MKKAKFADKITDLVEETLVSMGQSDPFTVYDNLDEEFSFTLEHDLTHRAINVDLTEYYETKQSEDVKVKDLYNESIKSRVTDFVNLSLELAQTERYAGPSFEEDEEYDEDEEDYDDEEEEEDEEDRFPFGNNERIRAIDLDDMDDEDEEDYMNAQKALWEADGTWHEGDEEEFLSIPRDNDDFVPFAPTPIPENVMYDGNKEKAKELGVKVSLAKDVLPPFLKGDRFDQCVFVEYPRDTERRLYQMDPDVYQIVWNELEGKEPYIVILDDYHLMCVAGEEADYLQQMLKDMKDAGVNIKDSELYHFEGGNLAHVYAPDGRQVYNIDTEEDRDI